MKNGIVGANGEMGKFLVNFLAPLGPVATVSSKGSQEEWDQVFQSDVIWLSIPRDAISKVLQNVNLKPEQLVIDICSIKRNLSEVIKKTGAKHLSLHPLHGPYIPISGQKWAVVPTGNIDLESGSAKEIINLLKNKEIKLVYADSEDHHDFMMALTLSIPELLSVMMDELINQYVKDNSAKMPTKEDLKIWSIPAFNAIYNTYIHIVNSTAPWLRADILGKAHGNLLNSARNSFKELSETLTPESIEEYLKKQQEQISQLSEAERENCRSWIERWFVDSNKRTFHKDGGGISKPELNIQYSLPIENIFLEQEDKIKVGIHGIAGCFTHESILRFCEETKYDLDKLDLKFLVTAENVLKAINSGEVDYGVFAMANSGSGAYVSSMHAMGDYSFEVLAVYGMEVVQCLMGDANTEIGDIKEVFGHPQAVSQCKRTFAEKYPQIKLTYGEDKDDTALCAKMVADGDLPKTTATLASQVAARLYGLKIFAYGMHHDPYNTTTFLIVKKRG